MLQVEFFKTVRKEIPKKHRCCIQQTENLENMRDGKIWRTQKQMSVTDNVSFMLLKRVFQYI